MYCLGCNSKRHRYKAKHLKDMSDPRNPLYERGIAQGISDGIMLDFKKDLHEFKGQWRQAREAEDGLVRMRGR